MLQIVKRVTVCNLTHDIAEIIINGEIFAFLCKRNDPVNPISLILSGNYLVGSYDCNACALIAAAKLEGLISILNAKHFEEFAAREPYLQVLASNAVSKYAHNDAETIH